MSIFQFSKVRITNHRPPPGAGEKSALEHNVRPGAALAQICKICGVHFSRSLKSTRETCSSECMNRAKVIKSIKPEYWWLNSSGYIEGNVWIEGKRRRIRQHRWIMEQHLGRRLSRWEHVHHKDGNKTNNDIQNLELLDHVEHAIRHNNERRMANGWNPPLRAVLYVKRRSEERRVRRAAI